MFGEKNTEEKIFTPDEDIITSNTNNTSIERFVLFIYNCSVDKDRTCSSRTVCENETSFPVTET